MGPQDRPDPGEAPAADGDSISGREAVDWGLATDWAPAAELDAAFESLLERVARIPINQLVMHKLQINSTITAQGLYATQAMSTFFDGIARHTARATSSCAAPPRAASRRRSASATSRSATSASPEARSRVKVLITSSRMPFALGMVRQLADAGHEVYAADDYARSPGSHSKYLAGHFVYPSATGETEAFIDALERIIGEAGIDVVVPAFEEAFFISTQREARRGRRRSSLPTSRALARLHDKAAFQGLVRALGCRFPRAWSPPPTPSWRLRSSASIVTSARAVFSRGGVDLLTNTGPLAGALEPGGCTRRRREPWLIQPFVEGETVCTYSTVHSGTVTSHLMYRIPRQWHHSTGIQFESIDATESLRLIEPIAAELDYTGQISFDFLVTDDGLSFVECNPRATDGALLLAPDQIAGACWTPTPTPSSCRRARRRSSTWRWSATRSPTTSNACRGPSGTWPASRTPATGGTTRCRRSTRPSRSPTSRASSTASTLSSRTRWTPT